jgi:phage replication O-like protein O
MQLPNYTQVSNDFIDRIMRDCKGSEVKVALVIFRKTIGWHKRTEAVPFSQIRELSGISDNRDIRRALEGLEEKGVIVVHRGERKASGHWEGWTYDLNMEEAPAEDSGKSRPQEEPGGKITPEARWENHTGTPANPGGKITPSKERARKESSSKESEDESNAMLLAEINRLQKIKPNSGFLANAKAAAELGKGLTENQRATLDMMSRENPRKEAVKEEASTWQPDRDYREGVMYNTGAEGERDHKALEELERLSGTDGPMSAAMWCAANGVEIRDHDHWEDILARAHAVTSVDTASVNEAEPVEIF